MSLEEKPSFKLLTVAEVTRINRALCKEDGSPSGPVPDANLSFVLDHAAGRLLTGFQDLHRDITGVPSLPLPLRAEFGNAPANPVAISHLKRLWADAAAALAFNMIHLTPFRSCNCSTAALAIRTWFYMHGLRLDFPPDEPANAFAGFYERGSTMKEIADFLFDGIIVE